MVYVATIWVVVVVKGAVAGFTLDTGAVPTDAGIGVAGIGMPVVALVRVQGQLVMVRVWEAVAV